VNLGFSYSMVQDLFGAERYDMIAQSLPSLGRVPSAKLDWVLRTGALCTANVRASAIVRRSLPINDQVGNL